MNREDIVYDIGADWIKREALERVSRAGVRLFRISVSSDSLKPKPNEQYYRQWTFPRDSFSIRRDNKKPCYDDGWSHYLSTADEHHLQGPCVRVKKRSMPFRLPWSAGGQRALGFE
jgi:hypothetical protein